MFSFRFPRTQRNLYFWFLAFASFLVVVSLMTLLGAASELSNSSAELKNLKVASPNLEDFVNTYPLSSIAYKGEKEFVYPDWKFTRYMLIGTI